MSTSRESWRLKLVRARDHLNEIEALIATYGQTQAHAAVRVKPAKRQPNLWVYNLKITVPPDPMLAVVIGDVVHNARSALDHIAVALVPNKHRSAASFPIRM